MSDSIDEVFAGPMRQHAHAIGDAIHAHRIVAEAVDVDQAERKLGQLFAVAVAAQQVLVALENPPPPPPYRHRRRPNFNLTVTTDKLRAALLEFNNA